MDKNRKLIEKRGFIASQKTYLRQEIVNKESVTVRETVKVLHSPFIQI